MQDNQHQQSEQKSTSSNSDNPCKRMRSLHQHGESSPSVHVAFRCGMTIICLLGLLDWNHPDARATALVIGPRHRSQSVVGSNNLSLRAFNNANHGHGNERAFTVSLHSVVSRNDAHAPSRQTSIIQPNNMLTTSTSTYNYESSGSTQYVEMAPTRTTAEDQRGDGSLSATAIQDTIRSFLDEQQILDEDFVNHSNEATRNSNGDEYSNSMNFMSKEWNPHEGTAAAAPSAFKLRNERIRAHSSQAAAADMGMGMGLFGDRIAAGPQQQQALSNPFLDNYVNILPNAPFPGTILVNPRKQTQTPVRPQEAYSYSVSSFSPASGASAPWKSSTNTPRDYKGIKDSIEVRVATHLEDRDMALLRKACFYDPYRRDDPSYPTFPFVERSCEAMGFRRRRGAMCLVAAVPYEKLQPTYNARHFHHHPHSQTDWVAGTLEVSIHEFYGTQLGQSRPSSSLLYITEVAVSPDARRCGAASKLLKGVDVFAQEMGVESVFLHVEATNDAAIRLYQQAGYSVVSPSPTIAETPDTFSFKEFTRFLNLHDEAPSGKQHYLLCKDVSYSSSRPQATSMVDESWTSSPASAARHLVSQ